MHMQTHAQRERKTNAVCAAGIRMSTNQGAVRHFPSNVVRTPQSDPRLESNRRCRHERLALLFAANFNESLHTHTHTCAFMLRAEVYTRTFAMPVIVCIVVTLISTPQRTLGAHARSNKKKTAPPNSPPSSLQLPPAQRSSQPSTIIANDGFRARGAFAVTFAVLLSPYR